MVERTPVGGGSTRELIAQARERRDALESVEALMASATGTAHDVDNTIELTVDARGALLRLWLAPSAASWGPDQLGSLLVEVARVAQREAVQASYNLVALRLGEQATYLIEQLSGMPAPARNPADDPGITVEEFQRRRAERLRETRRRGHDGPAPAAEGSVEEDELATFDPATLRSDR
ncbi:hypothetical protein B1813_18320 [Saccharomonospora piscinae]|uniref:YbaB/EbfC DNA-binding family protein n=1 Tax=Saccharomonospora piscinae TaxID=687388 RepID=A0A1V8ZYH7_SACPI|nr:hypothetical protein [Saccharomonospora piscinae]OQO89813.1 hypothetical protein B1813_18320 [Saccharomonospora piscinae]